MAADFTLRTTEDHAFVVTPYSAAASEFLTEQGFKIVPFNITFNNVESLVRFLKSIQNTNLKIHTTA